jgi:trigger factor
MNKILEPIMRLAPAEIPESMVRMELDQRWRQLARRFNTDANGLYKMMGNSNERIESLLESWKPDATRAIHSRLIVETLMNDLKIEATDEELEKELEKIAVENNVDLEEVEKHYEDFQFKRRYQGKKND